MIEREKILELAAEELADANTKHPPMFSSAHEVYAVLKEEIEEAMDEFSAIGNGMKVLWNNVKEDLDTDGPIFAIQYDAIRCVQELIQVIAMCDKATQRYSRKVLNITE